MPQEFAFELVGGEQNNRAMNSVPVPECIKIAPITLNIFEAVLLREVGQFSQGCEVNENACIIVIWAESSDLLDRRFRESFVEMGETAGHDFAL